MPGIKEHVENSLTLNHHLNPFARRVLKIGIGFLLVLAVLSSGLILQTSYAYSIEDLPLNLVRYPLRGSQPDHYTIQVRPQTPTKAPLEIIGNRNITVSGRGQISARPDQAVIYLDVQTEARNAEQAAEQLVSLLDTELGEVLPISETSQMPYPVKPEAPAFDQASGAPIEPGPQLLQVEVQVTCLLR